MYHDDNDNVLSQEMVESVVSEIIRNEGVEDGKLVISAGSSKGDGYMSHMTRVDVLGKNKNLHLIIKCAPKNADFRKQAPINQIFNREIKFYTQIYPKIQKFQEKRNVEDPFKSIAKCYKIVSTELKELLVLENIRKKGFDLWDKKLPMDENHMQLVLKQYAKFHAVSYAMQELEPNKFSELVEDLPFLFTPQYVGQEFFDPIIMILDQVESIFVAEKEILCKVRNFKKNVIDYMSYISKHVSRFATIVHGDCWCNNMMFKYQDPTNKLNPSDVCLLDFQDCFLNSPVIDLSYFIYSNSTKERLTKLDYYLDTYHKHLGSHLQALGCKSIPVSIDNIKSDWPLYSKFGYILTLMVVKGALIEPEEAMNFTDLLESGRPVSDMFFRDFKNKSAMNKKYDDLTRHMYENGFLDFQE